MNTKVKSLIANIMDAETIFQNDVGNALIRYRADKAKITMTASRFKSEYEKQYVDENLPVLKQSARDALGRAEQSFRKSLKENVDGLKKELKSAISAPISAAFTERLAFYRAASLTPSQTETEILLQLAGKSPIAISAIAKLLDDQNAPIFVECRSVADFEKDLKNLDDLTEMPLLHSPNEVHNELCDIMKGQPKLTRTANGWKSIGYSWEDSADLLMQGTDVSCRLKKLADVADTWAADVSYQLREREHAADTAKERQEAGDSGKHFKPEAEPESAVHIEFRKTGGIELARELGKEAGRKADVSAYEK
ncbi:MAG: hypothetical protein IKH57_09835 [Clostridia bacterium]|nr:hypothetical protein [Clostridia bacterium]